MSSRPLTVALTGGIGSGKTTVTGMFRDLGVPIIDADEISRRVAQPGGTAYPAMVALLGPAALAADGTIRRDYVRTQVFQNEDLRRELEQIVHPVVRQEMRRAIGAVDHAYCIVSIPLLLETGAAGDYDRVLVVDVAEEEQVRRTALRDGVQAGDVNRIMQSQATRATRLRAADDVIDNSGDPEALRAHVRALHGQYLALAHDTGRRP